MTELRDAVLKADESEDDEAIMKTLGELKNFVFSNIVINIVDENGAQKITFGTGPFYLEHQYIRAANAALKEAEEKLSADTCYHLSKEYASFNWGFAWDILDDALLDLIPQGNSFAPVHDPDGRLYLGERYVLKEITPKDEIAIQNLWTAIFGDCGGEQE